MPKVLVLVGERNKTFVGDPHVGRRVLGCQHDLEMARFPEFLNVDKRRFGLEYNKTDDQCDPANNESHDDHCDKEAHELFGAESFVIFPRLGIKTSFSDGCIFRGRSPVDLIPWNLDYVGLDLWGRIMRRRRAR